MENPYGYGRVILNDQGWVDDIVEEKDASAEQKTIQLVNTGAFCADGAQLPALLDRIDSDNAQNEFYITQLPSIIRAEGGATAVAIIENPSEVQGCNTRADLAALEKTLQNRLRRAHMDQGVSMRDPDTVYLWHDTQIAPDCILEPNVVFGPGVRIASGARIRAFSHLEGAIVGEGCEVGPYARLRPGAELGPEVHIGNFVEVKNSKLAAGAKANHLAYLGDAVVGERVNYGAGSITANYDGANKHRTVIEADVHVGSNCVLVAPVTVGAGATVGGGSTITDDVPAGTLAVARGRLVARGEWRRDGSRAWLIDWRIRLNSGSTPIRFCT